MKGKEQFEPEVNKEAIKNIIDSCNDINVASVVEQLKQIAKNQYKSVEDIKEIIENSLEEIAAKQINNAKDIHSKTASDIERQDKDKHELIAKTKVLLKIKAGLPKLFS